MTRARLSEGARDNLGLPPASTLGSWLLQAPGMYTEQQEPCSCGKCSNYYSNTVHTSSKSLTLSTALQGNVGWIHCV